MYKYIYGEIYVHLCVCIHTHVPYTHAWICLHTNKYTCTYKNLILLRKIKLYLCDGYCREKPADFPAPLPASKPQRITEQKSCALPSSQCSSQHCRLPKKSKPCHASLVAALHPHSGSRVDFFPLINLLLLLFLFIACHVEDYGQ